MRRALLITFAALGALVGYAVAPHPAGWAFDEDSHRG